MTFETERLSIRGWRPEDAPRVLDIRSRVEVVRWLGTVEPVVMQDLAEATERIQDWNRRDDPPCGYWAIEVKETGVVAGAVLLLPLPNGDGEVEIGWHLHPDSHGHGYATEAAAAVLRRGFEGGLPEILALTDADNHPSQAVCARLGMTEIGTVRKWYDVESSLFRITAEDATVD
jgi:RimJ/RimL family protein N-acetyltransferase